jgi:hypothetical protein
MLVPAVGLVVCAEKARAQKPPYSTFEINKIISANVDLTAQEKKILDEYFDGFFLQLFKKPIRPNDLPNLRNKIFKIVVKNAGKTAAHDYVNKKLLKEMVGILGGSEDKAIKYNAMLMIADFNESDENRNVKPLPEALRYLTFVAYTDKMEWDYLKPAALIGLARFADEGGIPKDQMAQVTQHLLELVEQRDPPAGRSASAHNFLRRGAACALAAMHSTGPNDSVVKAFEKIAADPKARPTLRCEMARFLGELNYPAGTKVDMKQLANILGHQTVEICQRQLDLGRDKDQGATTRRMAMYVVEACTDGLQKLSSSSDGDKFIYELKQKLDRMHRELDDTEKTKDEAVADLVQTQIGEIKSMLLD